MGLLDGLLGQAGVSATGGGTVFDPTQDEMEVRFTAEGTPYNARPGTPLHEGHTRANQPMFDLPKSEPTEYLGPIGQSYSQGQGQQIPEGAYGSLGDHQTWSRQQAPTPSFERGGEQFVAKDDRGSMSPWLPQQTNFDDARNLMSSYQGGERIAQRDTGTFQDLTPNADPSQAMEMLAMFKKEGKALTDLQFEKAMGSLGMSDILEEHRSTLNTVDKHYQDSVYGNTDDFGNPLNTDDFGNAHYDQRVDNYVNSLNDRTGINDVERVANVAPQTTKPSWLEQNQDITQQSQDFVKNLGGNIADGATDLYEGAKDTYNDWTNPQPTGNSITNDIDYEARKKEWDLGFDPVRGVSNIVNDATDSITDAYKDFNKPDTRTQAQKWADAQKISDNLKQGITDTASSAWEGLGDAWNATDKVVTKEMLASKDLIADTYEGLLGSDIEDYKKGSTVGETLLTGVENFAESGAKEIDGLVQAISSPLETADAIGSLISGAVQHALPDDMSWNEDSKNMASAVADIYADRYGSVEGFKKSFAEEPVPVLLELVGAGLITKLAAAKSLSALKGVEMGQAVENFSDKAIEMASLGTIKDGGRMNVVDDGLLGQTLGATDEITELQSEIKRLKGLRGKDVTQRTIDELRWAEEDLLKLNPLVAHHNMSSEALKKHSEYGGDIAMPSLGISKPDAPFGTKKEVIFGDIALLGDKSLIDPKSSNTYSSDAYTGRSPREMVVFDKDVEKIKDALGADTLKFHNRALYDKGLHEPEWLAIDLKTQELLEARGYKPEDYPSFLSMKRQATEDLGYKEVSYITVEATRNPVELGEMKRLILPESGSKKEFTPKRALTEMRKQGGHKKGSEREIGDSDFLHDSRARAITSEKYQSLDKLVSERNRVQERSQYTHLEDGFSNMFDNTVKKIEDVFKANRGLKTSEYKDGNKTQINNLNRLDTLQVIQQVLLGEKIPDFMQLNTSDIVKIKQLVKPLEKMGREMPTAYFESKPNRIVNIGEFKTAIVPQGDTASIKRLEKLGIENIIEYKDQEGYLNAFKKNPELFFSKAIIPTGGLLGEDAINVEASEDEGEGLLSVKKKVEKPMNGVLDGIKAPTKFKPSNDLLDFVKNFENAPLAKSKNGTSKAYKDYDTTSQGFGSEPKKDGSPMTKEEADKAVIVQLIKANKAVDRLVKVDLNEHQRNALVSMLSNVKTARFAKSNALKALNNGNIKTFLKEAFDPKIGFVKAGGKISNGLVRRRAREKQIFTKGNYGN
jgi:lysozyme